MAYNVTLIPGDGTGPEIVEATKLVIGATGVEINWEEVEADEGAMAKHGTPLPSFVLDSIRKNKVALKGPITTPLGTGFRSVNVALRQELGLYACLRPCHSYVGVRSKYEKIDLVVVRENTEDLYAGVEFDRGTPEANQIVEMGKGKIRPNAAISGIPPTQLATHGTPHADASRSTFGTPSE